MSTSLACHNYPENGRVLAHLHRLYSLLFVGAAAQADLVGVISGGADAVRVVDSVAPLTARTCALVAPRRLAFVRIVGLGTV
jgi:hypothetical protein